MEKEYWKPIIGYDGIYEISNTGKIKSINYRNKGFSCILFPEKLLGGYSRITLFNSTIRKRFSISRLVAIHFIENPLNLPIACHKIEKLDENGFLYNGSDNLFWGTYSDNSKDMYKKGRSNNHFILNHPRSLLGKTGTNHHRSKAILQYSLEGDLIKEWGSGHEIQRELSFHRGNISSCCRGIYTTSNGFIWKYK